MSGDTGKSQYLAPLVTRLPEDIGFAFGPARQYAPGSWVTATSSVRAPSEAVRCTGLLQAVRPCSVSPS